MVNKHEENMKRVLLDTSVYGKLIEEPQTVIEIARQVPSHLVIYGFRTVRNELRETPPSLRFAGRSKRILLLNLYDSLMRNHDLTENKLIETLARDYFKTYIIKGNIAESKLRNDFLIIAAATIHHLDIVVSSDLHTMLSNNAIECYTQVNKKYGLPNPTFTPYENFKQTLRGLA